MAESDGTAGTLSFHHLPPLVESRALFLWLQHLENHGNKECYYWNQQLSITLLLERTNQWLLSTPSGLVNPRVKALSTDSTRLPCRSLMDSNRCPAPWWRTPPDRYHGEKPHNGVGASEASCSTTSELSLWKWTIWCVAFLRRTLISFTRIVNKPWSFISLSVGYNHMQIWLK